MGGEDGEDEGRGGVTTYTITLGYIQSFRCFNSSECLLVNP